MNYRLLLPLILLCSTCSASAQERWFEVELLLFKRNVDINHISEDLTVKDVKIDTSKSIPLLKTAANNFCSESASCLSADLPVLIDSKQFDSQDNGFQRLDNAQLQLTAQREKLEHHAGFAPLLHLAWRMPVKSRNNAQAIHLIAGENYAQVNSANNNSAVPEQQTESLKTQPDWPNPAQPVTDKWAVDGNFKIYLDHYLFIDSQLLVRQKTTQDIIPEVVESEQQKPEMQDNENDVQVLKLNDNIQPAEIKQETVITEALFDQNRRLRSGEIHYFDHPLLGIIVQIRKIPE